MEKLRRISSKSGKRFIDVVKAEDGSYLLQKYVEKYDPEEERTYKVRELPDPVSRFGDVSSAVSEAKRLLK